ncbi:MAG: hypothetical protein JSW13_00335, partial [Candidatus Aerophobus sp.]
MTYEATLLVFGILLLLIGLVGKVKAKELEIGTSSTIARTIIGILGIILIVVSLILVKPPILTSPKDTEHTENIKDDKEQLDEELRRGEEQLGALERERQDREEQLQQLDEELRRKKAEAENAQLEEERRRQQDELKQLEEERARKEAEELRKQLQEHRGNIIDKRQDSAPIHSKPIDVESNYPISADNIAKKSEVKSDYWDWTIFLKAPEDVLEQIEYVEYTLHP